MQKTKLGISVGLLGAAIYFACFFGGYTAAVILGGYILLCEDNAWLKKASVKALALMFGFSVLVSVIALIPNAIGFIDDICNIFNGDFYIEFVSDIIELINSGLAIIEKVLFIALGLKAFNQGSINVPVIDSLVNKHID